MKIQNVALVGAGAICAYFIWGLSEKLGEHLTVIASGERKERLKKEGIVINDKRYDLNVEGTGISYHFVPDILTDQWVKYASNMSHNLPQAILNVGMGAYADSEHVDFISHKIWEEVAAVAAAKGITITPFSGSEKTQERMPAFLLSRIWMQRGIRKLICLPVLWSTWVKNLMSLFLTVNIPSHAIKSLEEKNDGKFDY